MSVLDSDCCCGDDEERFNFWSFVLDLNSSKILTAPVKVIKSFSISFSITNLFLLFHISHMIITAKERSLMFFNLLRSTITEWNSFFLKSGTFIEPFANFYTLFDLGHVNMVCFIFSHLFYIFAHHMWFLIFLRDRANPVGRRWPDALQANNLNLAGIRRFQVNFHHCELTVEEDGESSIFWVWASVCPLFVQNIVPFYQKMRDPRREQQIVQHISLINNHGY